MARVLRILMVSFAIFSLSASAGIITCHVDNMSFELDTSKADLQEYKPQLSVGCVRYDMACFLESGMWTCSDIESPTSLYAIEIDASELRGVVSKLRENVIVSSKNLRCQSR